MNRCLKFFLVSLILFTTKLSAQTVLLDVDRKADTLVYTFGPNMKNFSHLYLAYGFVAGSSEQGADIKYINSKEIKFGFRYKRKLSNTYSIGSDLYYSNTVYHLNTDSVSIISNASNYDKVYFDFHSLGVGLYNRINLNKKRGNSIGSFIDLGLGFNWNFNISNTTVVEVSNGNIVKTITKELNYVEDFNLTPFLRLGFNRYVFFSSYRLLNNFTESYNYPEFPSLIVGLELGLF